MTIERMESDTIVNCDHCPNYVEIDSVDFEYVKSELKRMEWRLQKDEHDCWINICPICARIPGVVKW